MRILPHQHQHWFYVWIPLFGSFMWFATLWAMLITWLAQGRPKYVSQDGKIAYISDVGADVLKPLFIVGCAITGVSFFLSLTIERWLRHEGRLLPNMRKRERVLSTLAILGSFIGGCGLILLSIFDTKRFTSLHRVFLLVFIVGVGLSAIFTVAEYRWISRDFVEVRKLRAAYLTKGIIAGILILLAIAFAALLFTVVDAGAVVEWTIAFGFTFYMLTFFWDLRMSKGVHRGELSRQRLLAMKQNGQNVTTIREANEAGGGDLPAGMNLPGQGYPHGVAASNGNATMAQGGNGHAPYSQGYPASTYPANGRAANVASAGYVR
ncbi:Frag1/DRAM/Sfk1 family-domain-containing protein [Cerioporus squamosus]|nr:Frag1/DRAM/Sfk1 family-domain-containing protein [Cerioporus squamosus]